MESQDPFIWDPDAEHLHFTMHGPPRPLRRHRTRRGFMYNPSAALQGFFRNLVAEQLANHHNSTSIRSSSRGTAEVAGVVNGAKCTTKDDSDDDEESLHPPLLLFPANAPLSVTIHCRMPRPLSHFVNAQRGRPLRAAHSTAMMVGGPDVDNLAKFILDALQGLVYPDDRQVSSLHVSKLYHTDGGECRGATVVTIQREVDTTRSS